MEYGRLVLSLITAMAIFCYVGAVDESSIVHFQDPQDQEEFVQILRNMGFTSLAMQLQSSHDLLVGRKGPFTLFAPTEEALSNFNSPNSSPEKSSADYLLSHHIAKGLFTYADLQKLPNGTNLEAIAAHCSLVVTGNSHGGGRQDSISPSTQMPAEYHLVYFNGVLVSHPDILNDGLLAIHGVDKLLLDLDLDHSNYDTTAGAPVPAMMSPSPSSSASLGPDHPLNVITPFMLQDAALSLRDRGYNILALAMRIKSPELLRLQNLTIFTLSDDSVFSSEGQEFSNNVRYHVVPNMRLPLADLVQLPAGTRLKTLLHGQSLVVTIIIS